MVRVVSVSCLDRGTYDSCVREYVADGIPLDSEISDSEIQRYLQKPPIKAKSEPLKFGKKIS